MLDRSTGDPTDPGRPREDDDARDREAAAAPLEAVRALVAELDRARPAGARASWQELVTALQARAAGLARSRSATWRLATGSAVPLEHWTAGAWASQLRAALVADGFARRAADQAVAVVALDLRSTCPATTADEEPGPLEAYPVLSRLRAQLSAEAEEPAASAGGLVTRVAALRA
ncbi:hypothetical protein FHN55_00640 [Streptomyces sp. NP160]|uniref:hypothetical protein n=1 Tax=Streptomyces sp. NP160 TaxID=2586637 RepID=UPI00111BB4C7|nr:hypothetical protein [Streptomyces sp. NP160]TNM70232.1 hypothetical protein FHN55_00640 [Streptomyces sp. NP160]